METIGFLYVVAGLGVVGLAISDNYTQNEMNKVRSEVFGQITNTTTNKEIVEYIHESCNKTPWYVTTTGCESIMLKTFTTPTKTGD